MSSANVYSLITLLERLGPKAFDMNDILNGTNNPSPSDFDGAIDQINNHTCGTVGCVAGWAAALALATNPSLSNKSNSVTLAANFLGVAPEDRFRMFEPWLEGNTGDYEFTFANAIPMLKNFAETGEVQWK